MVSDGTPGPPRTVLAEPDTRPIRRLVWQGLGLMIKPTAQVNGRTVSIPFDTSALLTGTTVTCQLDATPAVECVPRLRVAGLAVAHTPCA